MSAELDARLREVCPDAQHRAQLLRFAALLLERNAVVNLTGAGDETAVLEHLLDAVTVAPFVRESLVDIGSGGGLPGIPLAIVCAVPVTLVESVGKKARFLEDAVAELDIVADVVACRAEDAAHDAGLREQFATATARAVGSLSTVLELTLPFLKIGGRALLQRGAISDAERRAATDAALMLGGEIGEEHVVGIGRSIVIVEKRSPTPLRFPRRAGVPEKRPLCFPPGRISA